MSQPKDHLSDETSDRLYTPEELASYAAAEDARNGSDPLTAQLPDLEHTVVPPRLPESAARPPAAARGLPPRPPRRCPRSAGSRRPPPRPPPQPRSRRPAGPAARPAARR